MANLSWQKRQRMMKFLSKLKEVHKDDDDTLIALGEIEAELNAKKYGLVWEEHEEAVDVMMRNNIPVFTECTDREIHASDGDDYNFLLEGDNLHSLYLLEKTHKGRVDVIYIDPPYNTEKSFIYNDKLIGNDDTYKHSKWLSFMQKRLLIAHDLLEKHGVILISINDFEGAQCKMLCDEIFGEKNFIGQLTWESTTQPINAGKARFLLQKKVESIYFYAKDKSKITGFILKELESELTYPHIGKYGNCRFEIIEKSDAGTYQRNTMKYKILGQFPRAGKRWQIGEETARQLEIEGKVELVDGIVKKAIYPEDEVDRRKFEPFWSHFKAEDVGTAQNGKDELNNIMGYAAGFDTVKPTKLIRSLLSHFKANAVILDFFAGSGTTAQAVLELNKEDGGNRKFILCTNNENGICENITYQRIKTVITGKREDDSEYSRGIPANLKYYRTDFVSKNEEYLSDALLDHVAEMVQLEHGIKLDGKHYIMVMDDDEADDLAAHWSEYPDVKALYVSKNVLFTTEQNALFKDVDVHIIPDYYFNFELREVGESW